ncbi:hypothetical protein Pfo_027126 [Paulownia fortunei]|nr:hypothetical protein Pfo_027126 [Paulownia fortunei]
MYIYVYPLQTTIMLVQESHLGEALHSEDMHDTTDEADETLSLCDLPLYSDQSGDWEEYFSLDSSHASNSMSSSQDDYFEFFSQELNPSAATATGFPPENIIFCGKLIPYKQPAATCQKDSSSLVQSKKKPSWPLFRWKFSSSRSSKNGTRSTTLMQQSPKRMHNTNKLGKGHGFPMHKMYLFLFGISRFSTEVELRDIKSRRSRRRCPSSPPPPPMFRIEYRGDEVSGGRNRGWGLWGVIKALSCG